MAGPGAAEAELPATVAAAWGVRERPHKGPKPARLRAGFGPFCDRSRTPQAAATVAGSSASAAPGPAIASSLRPIKLTPS